MHNTACRFHFVMCAHAAQSNGCWPVALTLHVRRMCCVADGKNGRQQAEGTGDEDDIAAQVGLGSVAAVSEP